MPSRFPGGGESPDLAAAAIANTKTAKDTGSYEQIPLTVNRVQYADDQTILDACEAEKLDWKYTELAELGTPVEAISDEAKRSRAVAYLVVKQNLDEREA